MIQEIIERNDGEEKMTVVLDNGAMVSMQMVQDVYNEITGKNERISKSYRVHHKTEFEDIKQLDAKIRQLYEQYNLIENNCNVTLYYADNCKETYSSFERFSIADKSSLSPVENIRIQYNFLILLPKTRRPQSYKIELDIHSRAAIKQSVTKENRIPRRIINVIASRTAILEIEYIDYTVARNFQTTIDQWFSGLVQSKEFKAFSFLQDNSHNVSIITRFSSASFICLYFFFQSGIWFTSTISLEQLFKISVVTFGTIFIVSGLAGVFGSGMGRAIDSIQPMSYLKLTRGDERAIRELEDANRKNKFKSLTNMILAVALNVVSVWLANEIGIGI